MQKKRPNERSPDRVTGSEKARKRNVEGRGIPQEKKSSGVAGMSDCFANSQKRCMTGGFTPARQKLKGQANQGHA